MDIIWTDIKMNAKASSNQIMSVQIRSDKVLQGRGPRWDR